MKRFGICFVLVVCLSVSVFAEDVGPYERVQLRWRVDQPLAFKTAMEATKESKYSLDFENLPNQETASLPADISWSPQSYSFITLLTPVNKNIISIKMLQNNMNLNAIEPKDEAELGSLLAKLSEKVYLRGEINRNGEVSSFYLAQGQKNLLALFFELPKFQVSVGDSWPLNINFCTVGPGFICDKAERLNKVQFAELKLDLEGEVIAVLHYTIVENVVGRIQTKNNSYQKVAMNYSFVGKAEFLIEKGTWKSFTGEMQYKSKGFVNFDIAQIFALQPTEDIPKVLLKL